MNPSFHSLVFITKKIEKLIDHTGYYLLEFNSSWLSIGINNNMKFILK